MYKKPMILAADDVAEGVYAASGSGSVYALYIDESVNQWTEEVDTHFEVHLSGDLSGHKIVTLTFSGTFREGFGGNGSISCQDNVAVLDLWNPTEVFTITLKGLTKGLSFISGTIEDAK